MNKFVWAIMREGWRDIPCIPVLSGENSQAWSGSTEKSLRTNQKIIFTNTHKWIFDCIDSRDRMQLFRAQQPPHPALLLQQQYNSVWATKLKEDF